MSSHLVIWKLYWLPLQVHLLKSLNDGLHLVLPPARLSQIFRESPHVLVEVLRVEVERGDGGEEHGVVGVDQLVTVLDVNAFFLAIDSSHSVSKSLDGHRPAPVSRIGRLHSTVGRRLASGRRDQ